MPKQHSLAIQADFIFTPQGIEAISLSESSSADFQYTIHGDADPDHARILEKWLESYLNGTPLALLPPRRERPFSSFTHLVFCKLTEIPFGNAISYEELAIRCNSKRAFRAVGSACGKNPWPLLVPCHRVVGKKGSLCGFSSGGITIKEILLSFESPEHAIS